MYAAVNLFAHLIACMAPMIAEITVPYPFVFFLGAVGLAMFVSSFLTEIIDKDTHDDDLLSEKADSLLDGDE